MYLPIHSVLCRWFFLFFSSKLHFLNPQLHLQEKKRKTDFMRRNTNPMISRQKKKKKRKKEEIHQEVSKWPSHCQASSSCIRVPLNIAFFLMRCGHFFTQKLHLKSLKISSNMRIFRISILRIYTWMGKKLICKLPNVFSQAWCWNACFGWRNPFSKNPRTCWGGLKKTSLAQSKVV